MKIKLIFKIINFISKNVKEVLNFWKISLLLLLQLTPLLSLIQQYIIKLIIGNFENHIGYNVTFLKFLVIGYVIILGLSYFLGLVKNNLYNLMNLKLSYNIERKVATKIESFPISIFDNVDFQNLYSEVKARGRYEIGNAITSILSLVSSVVAFFGCIYIILKFSVYMTIIILVSFMPFFILQIYCSKNEFKKFKTLSLNNRYKSYFFNLLVNPQILKDVRVFGLNEYFKNKHQSAFDTEYKNEKNLSIKNGILILFGHIISWIAMGFISIWLLNRLIKGEISISDFVWINGIILSFKSILLNLSEIVSLNYKNILYLKNLLDFFEIKIFDDKKKCLMVKNNANHVIEFINVSFKYPNSSNYAIKNLSLSFFTDEIVHISGKNGSGKTTIINLILRFYKPTEGEILLDGISIDKYDQKSYYTLFGLATQCTPKYAAKVNEYISFGNMEKTFSQKSIETSAKAATIHNHIINNNDYDSNLTKTFYNNGWELSSGQWQKLSIAKIFYSDLPILLFDEPTSNVDKGSCAQIYNYLNTIKKGKIIIIITHGSTTLLQADRKVYLKNGNVQEQQLL